MLGGKWQRKTAGYLNVAIEDSGITAGQFARRVNMDEGTLSRVRNGYEKLRVHHVPNILHVLPTLPKRKFKEAVLKQFTKEELRRQGVII